MSGLDPATNRFFPEAIAALYFVSERMALEGQASPSLADSLKAAGRLVPERSNRIP